MKKSKTFCVLPWNHMSVDPSGMTSLCCVSDHTNNLNTSRNFNTPTFRPLNLNENTMLEMMNSDYFKQVRLQMLDDEIPDACKRCFEAESLGRSSKRIEEMNRFSLTEEKARAITLADGSIPLALEFIELRLGNLCNIKCRTCNPGSSSKWTSEYNVVQKKLDFVAEFEHPTNCSWTESEKFWDDFLENSQNAKLMYINGGEPTLVERHWKFLESLIERKQNESMTLWYNINMTNLPTKLVEIWKQFKRVIVFCSIDDLYERNNYIRTGTDWKTVMQNLDTIQSHSWIESSVCQTVSWLNIYTLDEFYSFMKKRNLDVHLNLVFDPKFLNPSVLSDTLKKIVLDKVKTIDPWKFDSLKKHLSLPGDETLFEQGLKYNDLLDEMRSQSFKKMYPDWFDLIQSRKVVV